MIIFGIPLFVNNVYSHSSLPLISLVKDAVEQNASTDLTNALTFYKDSFNACRSQGPLMVYICKLFSIPGTDIVGMPDSKKMICCYENYE